MRLSLAPFPLVRALAVGWVCAFSFAQAPPAAGAVEGSVVKIFSTLRNADPVKPWSKQEPREATATGVILEGHRILTNAHVVMYSGQVQVQGQGAGDKVPATVVAVAPGIDLALLKVDDESFFDQRKPLARSKAIPDVKDEVMTYGYPMGGSNLSITKGIISRIEFTDYNFPVSGLRIQVDAAINPGNSGGPAVVNGKMVGLVFSYIWGSQGLGYIIPNEEIELFLDQVALGRPYTKPALYDDLPTLESPSLRAFLKVDKSVKGVVVHKPFGKENPLKVWDVITRIGDSPVDDEGMVQIRPNLRVHFRYQVQHLAKDGKVALMVVREGKSLELKVPVYTDHPVLVPDLRGAYPPYFVCGPLVFSTASVQLLAMTMHGGNPMMNMPMANPLAFATNPLFKLLLEPPSFSDQELVVISSPFLPHKLSRGYSNPQGNVVTTVNGTPVKNLRHLVTLLRDATDEFIAIDFSNPDREALVFPRKELLEATGDVLNENGIRSQGSPELMKVWNEAGAR